MNQLIKCLTIDLGSSLDLRVVGSDHIGLHTEHGTYLKKKTREFCRHNSDHSRQVPLFLPLEILSSLLRSTAW